MDAGVVDIAWNNDIEKNRVSMVVMPLTFGQDPIKNLDRVLLDKKGPIPIPIVMPLV